MKWRRHLVALLVVASALLAWGSCELLVGRWGEVDQTRTALIELDFGAAGYTPWAAMHMMLIVGESGGVRVNGQRRQCLELLVSDDLHPGSLLVNSGSGLVVGPASALFAHELEDHHAQFWALRAQSLHDRPEKSNEGQWMECARALLQLERSRDRGEREWLLILGGLTTRNLPLGDMRSAIFASTHRLLAEYLRGEGASPKDVAACGGMHGATAVQICVSIEELDSDLRNKAGQLLEVLAGHVRQYRHDDGYVEFPGLHYPFAGETARDRVRVLGHIVEWWSYQLSARRHDDMVVRCLERSVGELRATVAAGLLHSKEVGEMCHALGALARIDR